MSRMPPDPTTLTDTALLALVRGLPTEDLVNLSHRCGNWRMGHLLQSEEAAAVEPRRPGLAGRAAETLQLLTTPLDDLVRDLLAEAQRVGGHVQARTPPVYGEEAVALTRYGVELMAANTLFQRDVGDAWYAHLQRWERRHHEVVDAAVADLSAVGRAAALAEMGLMEAASLPGTAQARERLPARFEGTGSQLGVGLRVGTRRSSGLVEIIETARTLGAAALYLHRLVDAERPTLELLAQRVAWVSYAEGYRLAAIEGTHALLQAADALPSPEMPLSTATIAREALATLPRYRWSGPQDAETCGACEARRGHLVYALSVDDLPACQDICALGLACRHHYTPMLPDQG